MLWPGPNAEVPTCCQINATNSLVTFFKTTKFDNHSLQCFRPSINARLTLRWLCSEVDLAAAKF